MKEDFYNESGETLAQVARSGGGCLTSGHSRSAQGWA